ncbi:hypothetical protein V6O07_01665 [Arthrospira platensis SPKY2]
MKRIHKNEINKGNYFPLRTNLKIIPLIIPSIYNIYIGYIIAQELKQKVRINVQDIRYNLYCNDCIFKKRYKELILENDIDYQKSKEELLEYVVNIIISLIKNNCPREYIHVNSQYTAEDLDEFCDEYFYFNKKLIKKYGKTYYLIEKFEELFLGEYTGIKYKINDLFLEKKEIENLDIFRGLYFIKAKEDMYIYSLLQTFRDYKRFELLEHLLKDKSLFNDYLKHFNDKYEITINKRSNLKEELEKKSKSKNLEEKICLNPNIITNEDCIIKKLNRKEANKYLNKNIKYHVKDKDLYLNIELFNYTFLKQYCMSDDPDKNIDFIYKNNGFIKSGIYLSFFNDNNLSLYNIFKNPICWGDRGLEINQSNDLIKLLDEYLSIRFSFDDFFDDLVFLYQDKKNNFVTLDKKLEPSNIKIEDFERNKIQESFLPKEYKINNGIIVKEENFNYETIGIILYPDLNYNNKSYYKNNKKFYFIYKSKDIHDENFYI